MPQSLSKIAIHIIFSTKDRFPFLHEGVREDLYGYLSTVCKTNGGHTYRIGGTADHVHIATDISRTTSVSDLVRNLKVSSSKWLEEEKGINKFAWQRGYGAFSVSGSALERLVLYIANQEEHHREESFQDEYRRFLQRYDVEFDERFLWD